MESRSEMESEQRRVFVNFDSFAVRVARKFLEDAEDVIASMPASERVAITDHFIYMVSCFDSCRLNPNSELRFEYQKAEDALLLKYKSLLKRYYEKGFSDYSNLDYVLFTRKIIPEQEYEPLIISNKRGDDQREESREAVSARSLNKKGQFTFYQITSNRLKAIRQLMLLAQEPDGENEPTKQAPSLGSLGDNVDILDEKQKLWAVYYLMRESKVRLEKGDGARQRRMIASILEMKFSRVKELFPLQTKPYTPAQIKVLRTIIPFFDKHGAHDIGERIKLDIELAIDEGKDKSER